MKSKTVYLHIGSTKTGTSALQYFLLQNCHILSQKGFYYPVHEVDANGISSGNAKLLTRRIEDEFSAADILVSDIMNTELPNIILSSEYLYFLKDEKIEILNKFLAQTDTKVIVYLRRQDSMLMSVYHQQVKRHCCKVGMEAWYAENYKKNRYTYGQVKKWAQIFGTENIIVRPYEQRQFVGGTIFSDFLYLLKLELTAEFVLPAKRINPAYRIDALEAKRLFNILPLTHCLHSLDAVLQQFSESRQKQGDWPYPLMSPAQRIQISEYYAPYNAEIARDYLGRQDGCLFCDPPPNIDEPWKPYPGLSPRAVRDIAVYINRHNNAVSRQIGDAIALGLRSDDPSVKLAARTLAPGLKVFRPSAGILKSTAVCGLRGGVNAARQIYHTMPVKMRIPITAIVKSAYQKVKLISNNLRN